VASQLKLVNSVLLYTSPQEQQQSQDTRFHTAAFCLSIVVVRLPVPEVTDRMERLVFLTYNVLTVTLNHTHSLTHTGTVTSRGENVVLHYQVTVLVHHLPSAPKLTV